MATDDEGPSVEQLIRRQPSPNANPSSGTPDDGPSVDDLIKQHQALQQKTGIAPVTEPPAVQTRGQATTSIGNALMAGFVQGLNDSPEIQSLKKSPLGQMKNTKIDLGTPDPLTEEDYQKQYGDNTSASTGRFLGHLYASLPAMIGTGGATNMLTRPSMFAGGKFFASPVTQGVVTTARNAAQAAEFSGESGGTPTQNAEAAALGAGGAGLGKGAQWLASKNVLANPYVQSLLALVGGGMGLSHGGPFEAAAALFGVGGAAHYLGRMSPIANALIRQAANLVSGPAGPVIAGSAAPLVNPLAKDLSLMTGQ